ncbi:MAG: 50S ribosomal protein L1 [Dehalococcoidia bacterium]|jgi:large subunit ribosomal protein L1|nr:MAG: 50S ribosomal protein L1 [Dehalococcoidia bacterium]
MAKHGKRYQEAAQLVERTKEYDPQQAIALAKQAAYAKFDETVELHLHMGLDPRHADQQVRGVASLPHGLGKKINVLVFTQGEGVRIAEEAGAEHVGCDELVKRIEGGWLEFDIAIATPDVMNKVSKLGKILGRRGLMPNPKSGSIVPPNDLPRAISDAQKGRVDFRIDKTAVIHLPVGKLSLDNDKLLDNLATLIETVMRAKPSGAKGQYVRSATLSTSMGPGIKLDLNPTLELHAP